ncbi:MAG TPA: RNase H-like domain-containing protein, partial [Oculatellaceae cyanobacterium]
QYFTSLDLRSGYWQIPIHPEHQENTAFICEEGLFEYTVLPFGVCNGPSLFQRTMDSVLAGVKISKCLCYLDDIIVFGRTWQEHMENLEEVFKRLSSYDLVLGAKKCHFAKKEVHFLGHIVTREGVKTDPEKVKAVQNWPPCQNKTDIKKFLGTAGYYRRYIKDFSKVALPLTKLLRQDQPWEWGEKQEEAMSTLKKKLTETPILAHPDFDQPFILYTDASDCGLGAVLSQKDEQGKDKPIVYLSRTLTYAERNYDVREKEALAIVWACEELRPYLIGAHFTIVTDHKNLRWVMQATKPQRLCRWAMRLSEYDFEIHYRKGTTNGNADGLSRINEHKEEDTQILCIVPGDFACLAIEEILESRQLSERPYNLAQDTIAVIEEVTHPANHEQEVKPDMEEKYQDEEDKPDEKEEKTWEFPGLLKATEPSCPTQPPHFLSKSQKELFLAQRQDSSIGPIIAVLSGVAEENTLPQKAIKRMKECILDAETGLLHHSIGDPQEDEEVALLPLVIPKKMKSVVLAALHDSPLTGHLGHQKTMHRLYPRFFWWGMEKDTQRYIDACKTCRLTKITPPRRQGLHPLFTVTKPFDTVHFDFIGPLPKSKQGNEYIAVAIDRFSRWPEIAATRSCNSEDAASFLIDYVITRHGCPKRLITDQGSCFTGKLFRRLAERLGIQHIYTTKYNPQANGEVERLNRVLKAMIAAYVSSDWSDWDLCLQPIAFAYRSALSVSTMETPFTLVYGREPTLPVDVIFGSEEKCIEDFTEHRVNQTSWLKKAAEIAQEAQVMAAKNRNELKNQRRIDVTFRPGIDKVCIVAESIQPNEQPAMWRGRGYGPFLVVKKLNDLVYQVQVDPVDPTKIKTVHVNKMVPYRPDDLNEEAQHIVQSNGGVLPLNASDRADKDTSEADGSSGGRKLESDHHVGESNKPDVSPFAEGKERPSRTAPDPSVEKSGLSRSEVATEPQGQECARDGQGRKASDSYRNALESSCTEQGQGGNTEHRLPGKEEEELKVVEDKRKKKPFVEELENTAPGNWKRAVYPGLPKKKKEKAVKEGTKSHKKAREKPKGEWKKKSEMKENAKKLKGYGGGVWELQRLTGRKIEGGKLVYEVEWTGGEKTWEPPSNINRETLEDFNSQHPLSNKEAELWAGVPAEKNNHQPEEADPQPRRGKRSSKQQ